MSKASTLEERKKRLLAMAEEGGLERAHLLSEYKPLPTPIPPPAPAAAPAMPTQAAQNSPRKRRGLEEEDLEDPPPNEPESFGIQESRKGLRARGWVPKNTLFHPREITKGLAFAADLGLEWSEFCNLAIAVVMDPEKRTDSTNDLLLAIRSRRSE